MTAIRPPTRDEPLPRRLTDRFRLDAVLGRGGMGVVYAATDLLENQRAAVKLIRTDVIDEEKMVERFIREAKHTARLQNPHVVRVLDLGRSAAGEIYFAMERLEGRTLAEVLRDEPRLEVKRAVNLVRQLCDALAAAHDHGIIHRDVKPANLMLVRDASGGEQVKVLDFGIARALDDTQLTGTGVLVGTVEYMAPEQILGQPLDTRVDLYAVGALLYRLLTGTLVFPRTSAATLVYHHVNTSPEPLRQRAPEVFLPPALEWVVQRCLAKTAEARFPDARALSSALEAAMSGEATMPWTDQPRLPFAEAELIELDTRGLSVAQACSVCGTPAASFATSCAMCGGALLASSVARPGPMPEAPPAEMPAPLDAPSNIRHRFGDAARGLQTTPPKIAPTPAVLPLLDPADAIAEVPRDRRFVTVVSKLPASFYWRAALYCGSAGLTLRVGGFIGTLPAIALGSVAALAVGAVVVGKFSPDD